MQISQLVFFFHFRNIPFEKHIFTKSKETNTNVYSFSLLPLKLLKKPALTPFIILKYNFYLKFFRIWRIWKFYSNNAINQPLPEQYLCLQDLVGKYFHE